MPFVALMPIVRLAFMRKKKKKKSLNAFLKWKPPSFKHHSLFIGDGPRLSFVYSCLFKVFLFVLFYTETNQPFTRLCCYQLCQFISSLVNFKHFFSLCVISLPPDWEKYGKAYLKWVASIAMVTCWVDLTVTLECIFGRDSDTIIFNVGLF